MRLQQDLAWIRHRIRRHGLGVEFLAHQPPSWFQRGTEPLKYARRLTDLVEYEADVDQIERRFRERIRRDVMLPDLEVGRIDPVEKTRIDVRDQHVTRRANTRREPGGDRTGAAAHFKTVPARPDATVLQVTDGTWVKHRRQRGQTCRRFSAGVVEQIRHTSLLNRAIDRSPVRPTRR